MTARDFLIYVHYNHPSGDRFTEPYDLVESREVAIEKARKHLAEVDQSIEVWAEIFGPGIEESIGVERAADGTITESGV